MEQENASLAVEMYRKWRDGAAKSRLERETWDDGASHGKHFDHFIRRYLGDVPLSRPNTRRSTNNAGQQLPLTISYNVIADQVDREHAIELIDDVQSQLVQMADDPDMPQGVALIIDTVMLPKLRSVSGLISTGANNELENESNVARANGFIGEVLVAMQTAAAIGRDIGIGFAATITTFAQLEPAVRGIRTLIEGG